MTNQRIVHFHQDFFGSWLAVSFFPPPPLGGVDASWEQNTKHVRYSQFNRFHYHNKNVRANVKFCEEIQVLKEP